MSQRRPPVNVVAPRLLACHAVTLDFLELGLRDQWAKIVPFQSGTDAQRFGFLHKSLNDLIVYRFVDDQSRLCRADLSGMAENADGARTDDLYGIGVRIGNGG